MVVPSGFLQQLDQAARIPAIAAALLHAGVELVDQRDQRHLRLVALALGKTDAEILAHPIDGEAELELALDHGLPAVVHLPALRRALGDGADRLVHVAAGLLAEIDRRGQALDDAGDAHLVHHLGELARARHADQGDRLGVGMGYRPWPRERALGDAAPPRLLARRRGLFRFESLVLAPRPPRASEDRAGRAVFEKDPTTAHAREAPP